MRRVTGFSRKRLELLVALGLALGVAVLGVSFATSSGGDDLEAASTSPTPSGSKPVRVIVAGTNDALEQVTDGGIVGEGTFVPLALSPTTGPRALTGG